MSEREIGWCDVGAFVWVQSLYCEPCSGVVAARSDSLKRVVVAVQTAVGYMVCNFSECYETESDCLLAAAEVRRKEGFKKLEQAEEFVSRFNAIRARIASEAKADGGRRYVGVFDEVPNV